MHAWRYSECLQYSKMLQIIHNSDTLYVIWLFLNWKWILVHIYLYRVSQKKRNGGFSVHCELKVLHVYLFTSLDQTSSAEEIDTKIIKFGWVVLIILPISWYTCTVIFKFRSIFATDERRIMSGIAFHFNALGNPVEPCSFVDTDQWLSQNTTMKGHSQHNPSLIGGKNQAKFENDCVLTNGHRIKITQ